MTANRSMPRATVIPVLSTVRVDDAPAYHDRGGTAVTLDMTDQLGDRGAGTDPAGAGSGSRLASSTTAAANAWSSS